MEHNAPPPPSGIDDYVAEVVDRRFRGFAFNMDHKLYAWNVDQQTSHFIVDVSSTAVAHDIVVAWNAIFRQHGIFASAPSDGDPDFPGAVGCTFCDSIFATCESYLGHLLEVHPGATQEIYNAGGSYLL